MNNERPVEKHGLVLLDKPEGPTSHDMVDAARRALGVRRIGHAGTLDPFATGLLLLLVGEATRLQDYFLHRDKVYEGVIALGVETDTGDLTGKPVRELAPAHWPKIEAPMIRAIIAEHFSGEIQQTPPVFSALKVDGQRAYALARSGREVVLSPRKVTLGAFVISEPVDGRIPFRLRCSSGTYVRSVAVDLGKALGIPAHLHSLRRAAIGDLSVSGACQAAELGSAPILPVEKCLPLAGELTLTGDHPTVAGLRKGRWQLLMRDMKTEGLWAVRVDGDLAQIYEREGEKLRMTYNLLKG
ncbi:MAG: tRNA pseudouridine(55) synthase TruB [Spirochaetes bacterium]|nr:tRNA pseudouridine(55) synthase TruB [Spirochaetota bacterium]